jgi:hypothetical protein
LSKRTAHKGEGDMKGRSVRQIEREKTDKEIEGRERKRKTERERERGGGKREE